MEETNSILERQSETVGSTLFCNNENDYQAEGLIRRLVSYTRR